MSAFKSVRITGEPRCLNCGSLCDGAAQIDGELKFPKDGDFSFCLRCSNVAVFVQGPFGYALRAMTEPERVAYAMYVEQVRRAESDGDPTV